MGFAQNFAAQPTSSFGYYRGAPLYLGDGSNQGGTVAGNGQYAAGQGPAGQETSSWTPSIYYLFALIIGEMLIFGILAKHLG